VPSERTLPRTCTWPRETSLDPPELPKSWPTLPPICIDSDVEDDNASSRYDVSSSASPSPPPSTPIIHVAPSSPAGSPSCSFDILRPDPASSNLEHVASSKTRWTGIPRLLPSVTNTTSTVGYKNKKLRRVYYAPGLNPAADASRASLVSTHKPRPTHTNPASHSKSWCIEHTFSITASSPTRCPENPFLEPKVGSTSVQMGWQLASSSPSYVYGPLPLDADPRHILAPGSSVMDPVQSAARAQAEFEQEVRCAPALTQASRSRHRQNSKASSPESAGGTVEAELTSSSTEGGSSSLNVVSALTALGKPKKPCDLERNHICPRCGRAFNRPSSLRVHGHVHTGFRREYLHY
jgi:hypothetical protein